MTHAIENVGVRQFSRQIIWRFCQRHAVFRRSVREILLLPESFCPRQVPRVRLAQNFLRRIQLRQCWLGTVKLQIGKSQPKMSFPIVTLQLQRSLEIFDGVGWLFKIVQDEAAIHIPGGHLGVAFERPSEIV